MNIILLLLLSCLNLMVRSEVNLLIKKVSNSTFNVTCTDFGKDVVPDSELILFGMKNGIVNEFVKGFNVITTLIALPKKHNILCHSKKSNKTVNESLADSITNCKRGFFGTNCSQNCEDVLGTEFSNCQYYKICHKNACTCARGYFGGHCNQKCLSSSIMDIKYKQLKDKWHNACKRSCGHCKYKNDNTEYCNPETAECPYDCLPGYMGSKCEDKSINLLQLIRVLKIGYDFISLQIKSNNYDEKVNVPDMFYLEYKETHTDKLIDSVNFNLPVKENFTIRDLKSGETYSIRVTFKNLTSYDIPYINVTTNCYDVEKAFINYTLTNIRNTISVKIMSDNETCAGSSYFLKINESENEFTYIQNNTLVLDDVTLCYTTNVFLYSRFTNKKITFKQIENPYLAPNMVRKLTATPKENSIIVQWQIPNNMCGLSDKDFYYIEYEVSSYLGCDNTDNFYEKMNSTLTTDNHILLTNLTSYARYRINVAAVGNSFLGDSSSVIVDTLPSDYPDEVIENIKIVTNNYKNVTITWNKPSDCRNIKGVLQYYIEVLETGFTIVTNDTKIVLPGLRPYKTHTVHIKPMRPIGHSNEWNIYEIMFKTSPSEPDQVKNLQIFSHSHHTIKLRWKEPNVYNGILENYKLVYSCEHSSESCPGGDLIIEGTPCVVWENFICAELNNLIIGKHYHISVSAKNVDVPEYGKYNLVTSKTEYEPPTAPTDLTVSYDSTLREMTIKWGHPLKHGPVRIFEVNIEVIHTGFNVYHIKNRSKQIFNEYLEKQYSVTFDFIDPATTYKICVQGYNLFIGLQSCQVIETEPSKPSFRNNPSVRLLTENKTLSVEVQPEINYTDLNYSVLLIANYRDFDQSEIEIEELFLRNYSFRYTAVKIFERIRHDFTITINNFENEYIDIEETIYVLVALRTQYRSKYSMSIKKTTWVSSNSSIKYNSNLYLLLILLIIPITVLAYYMCKHSSKKRTNAAIQKSRESTGNNSKYQETKEEFREIST